MLILKIVIVITFFTIFFHAYISTKFLIEKTLGYPLFYIGILLTATGFIFLEHLLPFFLILSGSLLSLLGTGLIVRNIKHFATKDFLTGLYTRVYFYNEWLPKEIKRQERNKGQIAFVIMDIDNFKMINDNYGHKFGDNILKKVSKVVINNIRATDIAVRFGGDEILLAFPGASEKEAKKILKRIIGNLKGLRLNDSLFLTVSAGISVWKPGEKFDKVLDEADLKMYRTKNSKKVVIVGDEHLN